MTLPPTPSVVDLPTACARIYDGTTTLAPLPGWLHAMQTFGVRLGGEPTQLQAFAHAWRKLYSAALLLDHLQDGDDLDDAWLATLPTPIQYHLAYSVAMLAHQDLHTLTATIVFARATRLHSLWSTSVLQLAIGQYRDLTHTFQQAHGEAQDALDSYEALVLLKTGAAFGLALGGSATLATDDPLQIDAAIQAGLIFGMLLQYRDDLHDATAQVEQPSALTLLRAWAPHIQSDDAGQALQTAWTLIYAHYHQALEAILAPLPEPGQALIWTLLHDTFESPPDLPPDALRIRVRPTTIL
jgi:hypothetical protein